MLVGGTCCERSEEFTDKNVTASTARVGDVAHFYRFRQVPTTMSRCCSFRHSLRSGDAVQLASCLYLQRETGERISFAAFDDRLTTAARAEGLTLISLS
jgi:hypothetical protein